MKPLQVLSLGAGVQSSVLLLMSCRGELPRLDAAIFADTQWEPKAVYSHLGWLEEQAKAAGIPLYRVSEGNLRAEGIAFRQRAEQRHASIPLFVLNLDGSNGMINRQCTYQYKIRPIERCMKREILGLAPGQRAPKSPVIDQWFGITSDEIYRMKQSRDKWKRHVYPFCGFPHNAEALIGRRMNRQSCIEWLKINYPDHPAPRSACIACPFHSDEEWRKMRDNDPESWVDAVDFDHKIRQADKEGQKKRGLLVGLPFVHSQRVPLDQVDLTTDVDHGQGLLWGMGEECTGMCGV